MAKSSKVLQSPPNYSQVLPSLANSWQSPTNLLPSPANSCQNFKLVILRYFVLCGADLNVESLSFSQLPSHQDMVLLGSMTVTLFVESRAFERPLSTPETIPASLPPTMARLMTQKPLIQKVTLVKTGKNPKLPPSGDNAGLKRKRGA